MEWKIIQTRTDYPKPCKTVLATIQNRKGNRKVVLTQLSKCSSSYENWLGIDANVKVIAWKYVEAWH